VEEIGKIKNISMGSRSAEITIEAKRILDDVKLGDSISTNGVCLTVTSFDKTTFTVDVMPETMKVTNLGELRIGSRVNLERALRLGDRLGGHIVSGHIDGTGELESFRKDDIATLVTISAAPEIMKYIIKKGSIAIDGTSLTVYDLDRRSFSVSIIPHTKDETTLLDKKPGDIVNLECDLVGKYIESFSNFNKKEKSQITEDYLREKGFL
jgi:riboflavin synthase